MTDVEFWKKVIQADQEDIKKYGVGSFGINDDDDEEDYSDEEWED